jgi:hypothetical protein
MGIPIWGIFGLQLESLETKWHLGVALCPSIENIIRGKVVASPNSGCGEFCESTFTNYALTNLLFGLCRSVWIIDPLVTRPSPHPGTLTCPSTFKVLRAKECAQLYILLLFSHLDLYLSLPRNLGVRQKFTRWNNWSWLWAWVVPLRTPKLLEKLKCEYENENSGRRSWGMFLDSQHFKGKKGVLEVQDGD